MADEKPHAPLAIPDLAIPDLALPEVPNPAPRAPAPSTASRASAADLDDVLDLSLDRGRGVGVGGPSPPSTRRGEAGSGLDVGYDRIAAERAAAAAQRGPGTLVRVAALVVPVVVTLTTFAGLSWSLHRQGGVSLLHLAPSAFDGRSLAASGAVVAGFFASALLVGALALRRAPRSRSLIASAIVLLLAMLGMLTVALAATEENPLPPDGALVVPFLIPAALAFMALAAFLAARLRFRREGAAPKGRAVLFAALAGALSFAALELSPLAALVPRLR